MSLSKQQDFQKYLRQFKLNKNSVATQNYSIEVNGQSFPVFVNEFWTPRQRQANAIHEISYRACFKAQLPNFFISQFTKPGDTVYDPFNGRGTTTVEAALMGRNVIANDVNPLSGILTQPRIRIPELSDIKERLQKMPAVKKAKADIDLSMFYHRDTESEILGLKKYLDTRKGSRKEDDIDRWIRMVATNRLTGHSTGFFSVYTLPPNQAITAERQKKINRDRRQKPEYRDTRNLILRKSKSLLKEVDDEIRTNLAEVDFRFVNGDAAKTRSIKDNTVALTVTSPPFLDVVQYAGDNWLRCWFNSIDVTAVEKKITMSRTIEEWNRKMQLVFNELYRITCKGGVVAFEVGEVHKGKTRLEEAVVILGVKAGFRCEAIVINQQVFTKTSNIWGVSNNKSGTNSNRIVVLRKQ